MSRGGVPKRPVQEARIDAEGVAGDRLRIGGDVVLELTSCTVPSEHNARWFTDGDVRRISHKHDAARSRFYARVVQAEDVKYADEGFVEKNPGLGRGARGQRSRHNLEVIEEELG